jgi:hypothetical protein
LHSDYGADDENIMSDFAGLLGGYTDTGSSRIPRGYRLGRRAYSKLARSALRMQKRYMPSQYGRAFIRRGTPLSLSMFGKDAASASEAQKNLRKQLHYAGKGGYFGRLLGGALGSKFGMGTIGASLGDRAGDWLSDRARSLAGRYFGRGLYSADGSGMTEPATANSIVTAPNIIHDAAPMFAPATDGSIRITHKEYVGDIVAPGDGSLIFSSQRWALNPGMEATFPWLSQLAQNYTEYEFMQLAFTFESSLTSLQNASGQSGTVVINTQYNANEGPFSNKREMELAALTSSGNIMQNVIHGVECDPKLLSGPVGKYVRSQDSALTQQDKTQYDQGTLNIALTNVAATLANQAVGELFVSYTVVLRKPRLFTGIAKGIGRDVFVVPSPVSWQVPFNASGPPGILRGLGNSIGVTIDIANNLIEFPPQYSGTVRVRIRMTRLPVSSSETAVLTISGAPDFGIQGNTLSGIKYLRDIPRPATAAEGPALGADIWDYRIYQVKTTANAVVGPYYAVDLEGHFRVSPSTGGVANRLILYTGMAANADFPPQCVFMEVSEYNPTLSVSDTGSNDALQLVNTSGVSTQLPYMGPGGWV